jgi:biofilm PGA synthesis lipoprotein PgaB
MALLNQFIRQRLILLSTFLLGMALFGASVPAQASDDFISLCYHEVESDDTQQLTRTAIRVGDLALQFAWLQANGYQPVSVQQILDARASGPALPDKAVLLTFDDGKRDVYTRVLPLLRLFRFPAVVALVGSWLDVAPGSMVDYDGVPLARSEFVSWDEVSELQRSGLVEIASHSYNLHRGVLANPQGNTQPAATTRMRILDRYESDEVYVARLRDDLLRNRDLIAKRTGKKPRVMVWPYGRSNLAAQQVALELGMPMGLSLEDGLNTSDIPTASLRRYLIEDSPQLQSFAQAIRGVWSPNPWRSVRISPAQWSNTDQDLSATLDQVLRWSPNISFVDPRGTGDATLANNQERVLFPSALRPMAADQLNHIAWQLERRAFSSVFIEVPTAWLSEPELLADLAQHVNFSGLRLPVAPSDPAVAGVLQAIQRWRLPIQIAFAPRGAMTSDDWRLLRHNDLVVLPARPEIVASVPNAERRRTLFEFTATHDTARHVADEMRRLEAAGNRNFGLTNLPQNGVEIVWPAVSLRAERQLP